MSSASTSKFDFSDQKVPESYIKNVAIRLPGNFKFINSPLPIKQEDQRDHTFIGHAENLEKFSSFLEAGHGVFLVTGYRGMGKTSFVNKVISLYHKKHNTTDEHKVVTIPLTLAQNNPRELDILRLITTSAFDHHSKIQNQKANKGEKNLFVQGIRASIAKYVLITAITLLLLPAAFIWKPDLFINYLTNVNGFTAGSSAGIFGALKIISYFIVAFSLIYIIIYLLQFAIRDLKQKRTENENASTAYNRISLLKERCFSSMLQEQHQTESLNAFSSLPLYNLTKNKRNVKEYPIATAKEIEYELQQYLSEAKQENLEFIFVFDELDKVDPTLGIGSVQGELDQLDSQQKNDLSYQVDLQQRKQAVISVIAGLKNFLTSSAARFIFIAGREMFDASLADIADRQSAVSSIFTYIFNIESLLKTSEEGSLNGQNSSLSYSIERYLSAMLFGKEINTEKSLFELTASRYQVCNWKDDSQKQKIEELSAMSDGDKVKLYFTLQNFVTYLTYRSNGSPKKMIRSIQEHVTLSPINDYQKNIVFVDPDNEQAATGKHVYLYLNYYTQYKIGFISYLFRPFLIQYGRSFKLYSDNINVSTAFLFDHLIKYHPFAFSLTNLEQIPEVLSANKTPALKEFIRQIIQHLSANHLRETEISLFDYKFYSRTNNEISFLSKISEQEAAAFNFTLDENQLTKIHMRNKIKQLRKTYALFVGNDEQGRIPQIYSIAHINGILGDLHFFDQEYDDAITAYADANRPINHLQMNHMNMRDFFTLIKNKLKQGLCFEKIGGFVDALAFYNDSCEDSLNYMTYKIINSHKFNEEVKKKQVDHDISFSNSSLNDVLELIVQCFLAKLIIQEKMGLDGLSGPKVFVDLGNFLSIVDGITETSGRSYLIAGQAYLMTAKLLFYKNSSTGFEAISEYASYMPAHMVEYINRLISSEDTQHAKSYTRKPMLAYYLYIMGLNEVMASRRMLGSERNDQRHFLDNILKHPNLAYGILTQMETNLIHLESRRFTGVHFSQMGAFLSNIGDCLLSKLEGSPKSSAKSDPAKLFQVSKIFDVIENKLQTGLKESHFDPFTSSLLAAEKNDDQIADVIRCYYLASNYYQKYGKMHSASFQFRKILWVLRLVVDEEGGTEEVNQEFIDFIYKFVVQPALNLTSQNAEHTGHHVINKATHHNLNRDFIDNNLSNHPETREIILLYNYIRIKMRQQVDQSSAKNLISPYNSFASQYSRILELDFYAKSCYYKYIDERQKLDDKDLWTNDIEEVGKQYLFNMLSILKILKIYGTDFIAGHSYYAHTYYRIGDFLYKIRNAKRSIDQCSMIEYLREYINHISEEKTHTATDSVYHYRMAAELYRRTIQLHTAGKEYETAISDMIYLEDDFNDNAYHFGAAFERYMMVNGVFKKRLEQCDLHMPEHIEELKKMELENEKNKA